MTRPERLLLAALLALSIAGAAVPLAYAWTLAHQDRGPCFDDRYGRELPGLIGDDC